jgi:uncharacterized protein involved in type VI secretion and phage assembly
MSQPNAILPATVTDNIDPLNIGRIKVKISGSSGHPQEVWARIATLMAGNQRGTWFIPDLNDEVLVAFEANSIDQCFVIGALWSKTNSPPESNDKQNNIKQIRSRSGIRITLDDQTGHENLVVETPGGQQITLGGSPGSLVLKDSNGNSITLGPTGIVVNAAAQVTINAPMVEVNSAMSGFHGVVKCDTLISNSVVSASITPGSGNIW